MLRKLISVLLLSLLLLGTASILPGCVVVPYDNGYGHSHGYDRGHHDRGFNWDRHGGGHHRR